MEDFVFFSRTLINVLIFLFFRNFGTSGFWNLELGIGNRVGDMRELGLVFLFQER